MLRAFLVAPCLCKGQRITWRASSYHSRCAFTKFSSVVRRCSDSTNYSEQSHGAGSVLHRITSSPRGKTGSAALNRLSKPELQQELRLRGLSDHGKKPELKQRLFDALEIDTPATEAATRDAAATLQAPAQPNSADNISISSPPKVTAGGTASPQQYAGPHNDPSHGRDASSTPHASSLADLTHQQNAFATAPTSQQVRQATSASASAPNTLPTATAAAPSTASLARPATSASPNMSVTWLGTSSGAPSLRRNVSCMALNFGTDTYLVDCGEGSSRQVLKANINPLSIKGVFISHLHGDHCFGLPGLIQMISQAHAANAVTQQAGLNSSAEQPLRVFGPPGIQQLVKAALSADTSKLSMPLLVTDFTQDAQQAKPATAVDPTGLISFARQAPQQTSMQHLPPRPKSQGLNRHRGQQAKLQAHSIPVIPGLTWSIPCDNGLTVRAAQLQHRLPCWGYVLEEATQQHIPGRKVVLLGDTCESEAIAGLGMDADLLAHEATFAAGMEIKAHKAQHSTAPMAGEFARKIRANALVLTHFSNRYSSRGVAPRDEMRGASDNDHQDVLQQLITQARGAFGKDRVWAAYDFYTFDVRHRSRGQRSMARTQ